MSRIRLDIDDAVLARVRELYGLHSAEEAVDFALRQLLVDPLTDAEVGAVRGRGWHGDLDELRDGTAPRA